MIVEELLEFGGRGGKSGEVEGNAAQEGGPIRGRSERKIGALDASGEEGVD